MPRRSTATREVVSRSVEGPIHRTTYAEVRDRAAEGRAAAGARRHQARATGSATLAWNTWRHLEAWYGIIGIGAVYHTLNPRLFPEQIAWIINHAEDRLHLRRPDLRAAAREDRRASCRRVER